MRFSNMYALLVLAAALLIPGICSAQRAPGGAYRQTCRDVEVRGSTLYADCKDTRNDWHRTELRDFDRCRGEIENIDGRLRCAGGYGDRDHDRDRDRRYEEPRGSFVESCEHIRVDGDTLRASCRKKNGKWRDSWLRDYRRCRDIVNDNGRLECAR